MYLLDDGMKNRQHQHADARRQKKVKPETWDELEIGKMTVMAQPTHQYTRDTFSRCTFTYVSELLPPPGAVMETFVKVMFGPTGNDSFTPSTVGV